MGSTCPHTTSIAANSSNNGNALPPSAAHHLSAADGILNRDHYPQLRRGRAPFSRDTRERPEVRPASMRRREADVPTTLAISPRRLTQSRRLLGGPSSVGVFDRS